MKLHMWETTNHCVKHDFQCESGMFPSRALNTAAVTHKSPAVHQPWKCARKKKPQTYFTAKDSEHLQRREMWTGICATFGNGECIGVRHSRHSHSHRHSQSFNVERQTLNPVRLLLRDAIGSPLSRVHLDGEVAPKFAASLKKLYVCIVCPCIL